MSNSSEGNSTMNTIVMTSNNTNSIDDQQEDHTQAQQRANAPTATHAKKPQHAHKRPVALYCFLGFIITMLAVSELAQHMEAQQLSHPLQLSDTNTFSADPALQSGVMQSSVKSAMLLSEKFVNMIFYGQTYRVAPASIDDVTHKIMNQIEASEQELKQHSKAVAHRRINAVFDGAIANVDGFADWYYTLGSEYTRIWHALAQDSGKYLNKMVNEHLITREMHQKMAQTGSSIAKDINGLTDNQLNAIAGNITDILGANSISKNNKLRVKSDFDINLDQSFNGIFGELADWHTGDTVRQISAAGAGTAVGLAIGKSVGSKIAVTMGSAVMSSKALASVSVILAKIAVSKGLTAAGGTIAGATAGAGTGAAMCSGTLIAGPFGIAADTACAVAGGLIGGAAAWFATDKAVITIQDYMGRDDFNNSIINKLNASRAVMLNQTDAAIDQQVDAIFSTIRNTINQIAEQSSRTFTPAELSKR